MTLILVFAVLFSLVAFGQEENKTEKLPQIDVSSFTYSVSASAPKSIFRTELMGGDVHVDFRVYKNGVQLGKSETEKIDFNIEAEDLKTSSTVLEDGVLRVSLYKVTDSDFLSALLFWYPSYAFDAGQRTVRLTFYSEEDEMLVGETVDIAVKIESLFTYLTNFSIPILVLILVLGYALKSRFILSPKLYFIEVEEKDGKAFLKKKRLCRLSKHSVSKYLPFCANNVMIKGFKIYSKGLFWKRFCIKNRGNIEEFKILNTEDVSDEGIDLSVQDKGKRARIIFGNNKTVIIRTSDELIAFEAVRKKGGRKNEKNA